MLGDLRTCPQQLRQLAYFSLVRSWLEYSSIAWDPYLAKDITKLESIQRRAAQFTMNDHRRRSRVSNMLERLGWELLQERRAMARLTIMKKILCGRVTINCDDYLERSSTRTRTANSAKFNVSTLKCLKTHISPELYHFGMAHLTWGCEHSDRSVWVPYSTGCEFELAEWGAHHHPRTLLQRSLPHIKPEP